MRGKTKFAATCTTTLPFDPYQVATSRSFSILACVRNEFQGHSGILGSRNPLWPIDSAMECSSENLSLLDRPKQGPHAYPNTQASMMVITRIQNRCHVPIMPENTFESNHQYMATQAPIEATKEAPGQAFGSPATSHPAPA